MMKKLISAMIVSVSLSATALAGGPDGERFGGPRGEGMPPMHKLAKMLDLSESQKDQFKQLRQAGKAERREHKREDSAFYQLSQLDTQDADYPNKVEQLAAQHAEQARQRFLAMADMREKFASILTAEQLEKFKQLAHKRESRHGMAE